MKTTDYTNFNLDALHIWERIPNPNYAEVRIWTELKLILMSGIAGWWYISPRAVIFSQKLTPDFVAMFYHLLNKMHLWLNLIFNGNDALESFKNDPVNRARRDIDIEGWLVFVSLGRHARAEQPIVKIYSFKDLNFPFLVNAGCTWFNVFGNAKGFLTLTQNYKWDSANLKEFLVASMKYAKKSLQLLDTRTSCKLITPHGIVQSRQFTAEFRYKVQNVAKEWFSISNKLKKNLKERGKFNADFSDLKPELVVYGQPRKLSELNEIDVMHVTRRCRVMPQIIVPHYSGLVSLPRVVSISSVMKTVFKDCPVLTDYRDGRSDYRTPVRKLTSLEKFLFYTERLPLDGSKNSHDWRLESESESDDVRSESKRYTLFQEKCESDDISDFESFFHPKGLPPEHEDGLIDYRDKSKRCRVFDDEGDSGGCSSESDCLSDSDDPEIQNTCEDVDALFGKTETKSKSWFIELFRDISGWGCPTSTLPSWLRDYFLTSDRSRDTGATGNNRHKVCKPVGLEKLTTFST